jgi:hypothetical protein
VELFFCNECGAFLSGYGLNLIMFMDSKNSCSLPSVCYMVRYPTNRTRERKIQLNFLTDRFVTYCSLFICSITLAKSVTLGQFLILRLCFLFQIATLMEIPNVGLVGL